MTPFLPVLIVTPILLLLSLGIVMVVLRYQKRLIAHQQHLRELQDVRQRQVLEAALEAQEAERRRIARDLHDEAGTMLALVKLQVSQLCSSAVSGTAAITTCQTVKQQLDDVMGSVRRISHDLMPVVLEKVGLVPALKSLKKAIPPASGFTFELTNNQENQKLSAKLELTVYRVVQELLNNTLKHAGASQVQVDILYAPEQLTVTYSDNGKGFAGSLPNDAQPSQPGLGLTNLQSRVELLNGTFQYLSGEGTGFRAAIVLPIP
ncbi:sensor histidine kinase [Botryobacter ruber]|uniref:sensor histidine kinase n=1 Tax=Botryobacter ruber TaxID=2171629 RepID=UPI000E0B0D3E|nr:sensor histidine kinase [Botryobacter ruber]